MKKTYTRKEVEEIVREAELAFSDFLAKSGGAAEKLSKAEEPPKEGDKKDGEKSTEESTTTESSKSAEGSPEKSPLEQKEMPPQLKEAVGEKSKDKPEESTTESTTSATAAEKMEPMASESSKSPAPEGSLSSESSSSVSSPAAEAPPSLDAMYAGMGKEELCSHYRAAKKAMWKGMAGSVAKSEGTPKADSGLEALQKSVAELGSANESLRKENDGLKKTQAAAEKVISLLARPARRAVVSADQVVGKPGEKIGEAPGAESKLSKAEVDERLVALTRSDKLSAGEREEINKFYLERGDTSGVMKIIASKQEAK